MQTFADFAAAAASGLQIHFLRYGRHWIVLLLVVALGWGGIYFFFAPPANFPSGKIIVIPQGSSGVAVARMLGEGHIVSRPNALRYLLRISGAGGRVHAGAYRFAEPQNLLTIALRLTAGDFGIPPVRITVIEGATVRDVAPKIADNLPEVTAEAFISAGQPYEGYLFPDTYVFQPDATADSIVAAMRANFAMKTKSLAGDIAASGHSIADIVIMASIVEKETRTAEDRRIVAGILWNRIMRGMPLQVDAVFGYIFSKPTYSPSFADLKIDSPYNTYKYKGLPPGPIGNPGLDSIIAAIHPTKTNYVFYISDRQGIMHYARTYAEQLANQKKYLQ